MRSLWAKLTTGMSMHRGVGGSGERRLRRFLVNLAEGGQRGQEGGNERRREYA